MNAAGQLLRFLEMLKLQGITHLPLIQESPSDELFQEVAACSACRLHKEARNKVFGQGPVPCKVMLVGEGPGAEEDKTGLPFVGRAGQLLDRILAAVQMKRTDVYMANIVKCRPPENRTPLPDEISACLPFLWKQIEMVDPVFVVALGAVAARTMLNKTGALTRMRGRFYSLNGRVYMATYHPAALLRNERYKRPAWEDWKMFRRAFDEYNSTGKLPDTVIVSGSQGKR